MLSSHIKIHQHIYLDLFYTMLDLCIFLSSFKQCYFLFITNMLLSTLQDVWITCEFVSAVWTLVLTAPIHCRGFIDEQAM